VCSTGKAEHKRDLGEIGQNTLMQLMEKTTFKGFIHLYLPSLFDVVIE
jgi:hypothetical protein